VFWLRRTAAASFARGALRANCVDSILHLTQESFLFDGHDSAHGIGIAAGHDEPFRSSPPSGRAFDAPKDKLQRGPSTTVRQLSGFPLARE
jgi:hypothetical protein